MLGTVQGCKGASMAEDGGHIHRRQEMCPEVERCEADHRGLAGHGGILDSILGNVGSK